MSTSSKHPAFVYGMDYAASVDVYSRIKQKIKFGVETIQNVEFSDTKELCRVNMVDPLGITYLRVRGIRGIENPFQFLIIFTGVISPKILISCAL